jgi:hypothetical protein
MPSNAATILCTEIKEPIKQQAMCEYYIAMWVCFWLTSVAQINYSQKEEHSFQACHTPLPGKSNVKYKQIFFHY